MNMTMRSSSVMSNRSIVLNKPPTHLQEIVGSGGQGDVLKNTEERRRQIVYWGSQGHRRLRLTMENPQFQYMKPNGKFSEVCPESTLQKMYREKMFCGTSKFKIGENHRIVSLKELINWNGESAPFSMTFALQKASQSMQEFSRFVSSAFDQECLLLEEQFKDLCETMLRENDDEIVNFKWQHREQETLRRLEKQRMENERIQRVKDGKSPSNPYASTRTTEVKSPSPPTTSSIGTMTDDLVEEPAEPVLSSPASLMTSADLTSEIQSRIVKRSAQPSPSAYSNTDSETEETAFYSNSSSPTFTMEHPFRTAITTSPPPACNLPMPPFPMVPNGAKMVPMVPIRVGPMPGPPPLMRHAFCPPFPVPFHGPFVPMGGFVPFHIRY